MQLARLPETKEFEQFEIKSIEKKIDETNKITQVAINNFENHVRFFADQNGDLTYESMVRTLTSLGKQSSLFCRVVALAVLTDSNLKHVVEYIDPNSCWGPMYNWKIKVSRLKEAMHPAATRVWDKEGKFDPERFKFITGYLKNGELTKENIQVMLDACKARDEKFLNENKTGCPFTAINIMAGRAFGNISWHFITLLGRLDEALLRQFFTDASVIYQRLADEKEQRDAAACCRVC